jgi:hypothetical protein
MAASAKNRRAAMGVKRDQIEEDGTFLEAAVTA